MDPFRIDSHKLIYHVSRVDDWLHNKLIYPIYLEISPSGTCNHRCSFCALDYMAYQKRYLDVSLLSDRLIEMGKLGIKSIMYAGEGEPLLHKQIIDIIKKTKQSGIDTAITTNGVFLDDFISKKILNDTKWIKVSINAGSKENYAKIHRTNSSDFDRVMKNISDAVKLKDQNNYDCTLGIQMILLPENHHEVIILTEIARNIGADYLVIKPYSQHLFSKTNKYEKIRYKEFLNLSERLSEYNTDNFHVIFRINTMRKWDNKCRQYNKCLALPFWSYIDAGGNIWGCSAYLGQNNFYYGNIYENTFQEIWEGEKRQKSISFVDQELNPEQCRINCRMDEVNKYLWELKNPQKHFNFI